MQVYIQHFEKHAQFKRSRREIQLKAAQILLANKLSLRDKTALSVGKDPKNDIWLKHSCVAPESLGRFVIQDGQVLGFALAGHDGVSVRASNGSNQYTLFPDGLSASWAGSTLTVVEHDTALLRRFLAVLPATHAHCFAFSGLWIGRGKVVATRKDRSLVVIVSLPSQDFSLPMMASRVGHTDTIQILFRDKTNDNKQTSSIGRMVQCQLDPAAPNAEFTIDFNYCFHSEAALNPEAFQSFPVASKGNLFDFALEAGEMLPWALE
ncbi:hypothetical protein HDU91_002125 [Kappamyces sp. JEL0680]|nr:hypothetical protein HDU91_002125 [Kappamyces sp. JEL0680]